MTDLLTTSLALKKSKMSQNNSKFLKRNHRIFVQKTSPKGTVFRVGLFVGMFIVLMSVVIAAAIKLQIDVNPWLVVR